MTRDSVLCKNWYLLGTHHWKSDGGVGTKQNKISCQGGSLKKQMCKEEVKKKTAADWIKLLPQFATLKSFSTYMD